MRLGVAESTEHRAMHSMIWLRDMLSHDVFEGTFCLTHRFKSQHSMQGFWEPIYAKGGVLRNMLCAIFRLDVQFFGPHS